MRRSFDPGVWLAMVQDGYIFYQSLNGVWLTKAVPPEYLSKLVEFPTKPGDCINIPTGVKHWHGAAPDRWFSHLAIEVPGEGCSNEWLEPVDDAQYSILK